MAFELISRALRGTTRPPLPELGPVRRAAVALVFRDSPGRWPQLLMIKRADRPGDPWSGHMAFPGGRVEQDENDAQAAIRESEEELGLRLEGAHRLGTLRPVIGPRLRKDKPTVHVQPFVFWVQGSPPLPLLPLPLHTGQRSMGSLTETAPLPRHTVHVMPERMGTSPSPRQ